MGPGETHYLNEIGPQDRIRVFVRAPFGRLEYYTVQYEAYIDGDWRPVVRYDPSHGYPHRDLLNADGTVADKLWFPTLSRKQALDAAAADLKANWPAYRADFIRRMR
jgi:hypothetical protein